MTEEGSGASPPSAAPHFQIASPSPALPAAAAAPVRRGTSQRTRLTACIVACALFMQNLDGTVISTALPAMARAFGADPLHMNVALTSYLLSLAVFIPTSGWMADRFGSRTVFRAAIAVFTLGSVLCGRADTLGFLVFARIIQGMGGAMMLPVGRLVLLRTVAKSELVAAMAWLTVPAMIGPVVGPPLGGLDRHLCVAGAGFSTSTCRSACSGSCWSRCSSRTCASRRRGGSTFRGSAVRRLRLGRADGRAGDGGAAGGGPLGHGR